MKGIIMRINESDPTINSVATSITLNGETSVIQRRADKVIIDATKIDLKGIRQEGS